VAYAFELAWPDPQLNPNWNII